MHRWRFSIGYFLPCIRNRATTRVRLLWPTQSNAVLVSRRDGDLLRRRSPFASSNPTERTCSRPTASQPAAFLERPAHSRGYYSEPTTEPLQLDVSIPFRLGHS